MQCPQCNSENPDRAKFCLNCGAKLATVCPQCGTTLPPQARFCLECGAPLGPAEQPPPAASAPDPLAGRLQRLVPKEFAERLLETRGRVERERRVVTILFAGFQSPSEIAGTLDPEDVMEIMEGAADILIEPIYRHEGTLARLAGDAILALFGAPISHENDPERAIRAALDIVERAQGYATRLEQEWSTPGFGARVGINTGLVVVGEVGSDLRVEYTAMGDVTNLAARLRQAAPTDGVLVSHDTYRHVRGLFEVQAREPITVKGRTEAVRVYLVTGSRPRPFRAPTRGMERVETRMIGRDAESRQLQETFRDAVEERETRVVTVLGDAGVGKSRLLYEFEDWLDLQPAAPGGFRCRARPELQSVPYGMIRDLFAFHFDIRETDTAAAALDKFRAGMANHLEVNQADLVGHLIGFDFSASPAVQNLIGSSSFAPLATAYLTNYFRATTAPGPHVILLEDAHWADDASLDLIDQLVGEIPAAPLLVLCLARPALFERRPHWGEGHPAHSRLQLYPLSKLDSRTLVAEILRKAGDVPAELRELIVNCAEGNPFYVEEIIKMLIEDGAIIPGETSWQVDLNRLGKVHVPPTLVGVLQSRLDTLPDREKETLQRASVVGREFWDAAVAHLAEPSPDRTTAEEPPEVDALQNLRGRELVFQREHSVFGGAREYIFKHALLRDVTYETVLLKLRRVYHKRLAEWLEANCRERLNEYSRLIAQHYERAGELPKAAQWMRRAGDLAYHISAYVEAIAAYARALELTPEEDRPRRIELLLGLGSAHDKLCDYPAAGAHLQAALDLARELGNALMSAKALSGLVWLAGVQGEYERAAALAEEELAAAKESDDRIAIAKALVDVAGAQDDDATTLRLYEESLAIFRELGNRPRIAISLLNMGNLNCRLLNYATGVQQYEGSMAIFRELGNRWGEANCLANIGLVAYQQDDYSKAIRYNEESLAIAREIADKEGIVLTSNNLGYASVGLGEKERARKHFREAISVATATGLVPLVLDSLLGMAKLHVQRGEHLRAAEWIGLVQSHPALGYETRVTLEAELQTLGQMLPAQELSAALARGRALEFKQVVAEI